VPWTPFAGTNRIRFRGSAVLAALSAPRWRSPVPLFDCPQSSAVGATEADGRLPTVPDTPNPAHQRVLETAERKGIPLEIITFSESTHTAAEAAAAVGAELGAIVKSLVFVAPTEHGMEAVVALVSGSNRVDIARLAAVVGLSSLRRASAQEANDATGFVIGGIPPFAHRRAVRVVMDPDLGRYPMVWAAAGTSNAVFTVPPATLRMLSNAVVAPLAEDPEADHGYPAGGPARRAPTGA